MSSDFEQEPRFPNLRPISSPPGLTTVNGIGCVVYGARDHDPETGTYVKTHCFTVLFVPIFALGAYRVADAPQGWYFIGKEPLSGLAKAWNLLVVGLILGVAGLVWWNSHTSSPQYVAGKKMERADRLAEEGKLTEAAGLYREVAQGATKHAGPAAEKFKGLLKEPLDSAPLQTAAELIQMAAGWTGRADVKEGLFERGVELAGKKGADDPRGALAVLDALEPLEPGPGQLAKARRGVLEKLVAKHPNDPELATSLALAYEQTGAADRCENLLMPHRDRLGSGEGARILGRILAHKGKVEEAAKLLVPYAEQNLPKLHEAEEAYQREAVSAEQEIIAELKNGTAAGFDYDGFRRADEAGKQTMARRYLLARLRDHAGFREASRKLAEFRPVVEVAIDLGIVHLKRARSKTDPDERRKELERAEKSFLAVEKSAGENLQYRLFLGQVKYWLGKEKEGKELFDQVLEKSGRTFEPLTAVAHVLREVGEVSEARKLAEQSYEKAPDADKKKGAAVLRALMTVDLEDKLTWLGRADQTRPHVKALLAATRGRLASRRGEDDEAARHYREAIDIYKGLPERSDTLNNTALVYQALYFVTGDGDALDQSLAMLEKALQLESRDSIVLGNVLELTEERAAREVIGETIDLKRLRLPAELAFLPYLYRDRTGRDRLTGQVREQPGIIKALSYANRLTVLARKRPSSYSTQVTVHATTGNVQALRELEKTLGEVELDLADAKKKALERLAGKRDDKDKEASAALVRRMEKRYGELAKDRRDTTFAVAASSLAALLIARHEYGEAVDADRVVKLCEEAHTAAPSLATEQALSNALLFRAHLQLISKDQDYAKMAQRVRRSLDPPYLIALAVSRGGKPRELALANKDVRRACDLLKVMWERFPDTPRVLTHVLLEATHPAAARKIAEALREDEFSRLSRTIALKLDPFSAGAAFEEYWALKAAGKEEAGKAVLKACAAHGIPMPFDVK